MTRPPDPVFTAAVRAELAARRVPARLARPTPGALRSVLVAAVVAAVLVPASVVAIMLGAARSADTPAAARVRDAQPCDATPTAPFDCHLYVAVGASEHGREVTWLPSQPLQAWFGLVDGRLTATIDDHVNTHSVPIALDGDRIRTKHGGSSTTVGCYQPDGTGAGCPDERFVDALLSAPARYSFDGAELSITSGAEILRLAPTAVAPGGRACGGQVAADPLPCTALLSVSGTDGDRRLDWLRTDPLHARITGTTGGYRLELSGDVTIDVGIRDRGGVLTSDPATALAFTAGRPTAASKRTMAFLAGFFDREVRCTVHFTTLLLDNGDQTIELEAVRA